jgi:hypothetical protein
MIQGRSRRQIWLKRGLPDRRCAVCAFAETTPLVIDASFHHLFHILAQERRESAPTNVRDVLAA